MGSLHELNGRPRYLVAGRTHPKVLAADGEAYRDARIEQARREGVGGLGVLRRRLPRHVIADCVGPVLGGRRAALRLDGPGHLRCSGRRHRERPAGRRHRLPARRRAPRPAARASSSITTIRDALASALRRVLTDPRLAGAMAAEARRLAPTMAWPVVAKAYLVPGAAASRRADRCWREHALPAIRPSAAHDATVAAPSSTRVSTSRRSEHGYCTDDMARVLVVATREPDPDEDAERPGRAGLAVPEASAGIRRRLPQPDGQHGPLGRRAGHGGLLGAEASGGWEPPPPTVRSPTLANWPSSSSSGPPRFGRRGRGRWRSRRWVPPSSSPSTRTIARRAHSSPTTPDRCPQPSDDPPGRGPSRASPTPTRSSPKR